MSSKREKITEGTESGSAYVESKQSKRIKTLDDLIKVAKVDLTKYDIERHVVNKWETAAFDKTHDKIVTEELWQVKVWLKPKNLLPQQMEDVAKSLLARLAKQRAVKTVRPLRAMAKDQTMLEMGVHDLHMGKYASALETGKSWNMDDTEKAFKDAVSYLLNKAARMERIEKIIWPVGQDAMHVTDIHNRTINGTPVDAAGRYFEVYERLVASYVWAMEQSVQVAPTEFVYVPGNHDFVSSWHAAKQLDAYFRSTKHAVVNAGASPRKYVEYGVNLLGMTHGDNEQLNTLPVLMAHEHAEAWGRTKFKEIHIGHTHKMKILGESYAGVRIRVLPSLSGTDAWHHTKGFKGRQASEAYLWNKQHGYSGHLSFNI
jgi:hypothetical protein